MDLTLNGQPTALPLGSCRTLLDLVRLVEAEAMEKGHIFTRMALDGREVEDYDDAAMEAVALESVSLVELETESGRVAALAVLKGAVAGADQMTEEMRRVGRLIQEQNEKEAMQLFADVLGGWLDMQTGLFSACAALDLDPEQVPLGAGTALTALTQQVELLNGAIAALEASDMLGLSDILEYEAPQVLGQVAEAVHALVERAEAPPPA